LSIISDQVTGAADRSETSPIASPAGTAIPGWNTCCCATISVVSSPAATMGLHGVAVTFGRTCSEVLYWRQRRGPVPLRFACAPGSVPEGGNRTMIGFRGPLTTPTPVL